MRAGPYRKAAPFSLLCAGISTVALRYDANLDGVRMSHGRTYGNAPLSKWVWKLNNPAKGVLPDDEVEIHRKPDHGYSRASAGGAGGVE